MTHTILHVIPSLGRGGIVTQLLQLAEHLARGEFEQHVVSLDANRATAGDFQRLGISPLSLGARSPLGPLAFWKLRQEMKRRQPNVVHTWSPQVHAFAGIAALSVGVGSLVTAVRRILPQRINLLDGKLLKQTRRIVVNSEAVRLNCVARRIESQKLQFIAAAVDVPKDALRSASRTIAAELNIPPNAKLIAHIGSLTVEKRLNELIWAIDQLQAVKVDAHLLFVGEGPLQKPLERYARLNHVQARVHFLGSRADVVQILNQCDVLWHAAANAGHSFAILEAMAAGIPVVAADAGGNRELVVPGETGYLVPLGERAGFARSTLPLLDSAELARQIGQAARQRALASPSVEQVAAQFAELYREVSEKSG